MSKAVRGQGQVRAVVAEWTERREGKGSRHNNVAKRALATRLHSRL